MYKQDEHGSTAREQRAAGNKGVQTKKRTDSNERRAAIRKIRLEKERSMKTEANTETDRIQDLFSFSGAVLNRLFFTLKVSSL